MWCQSLGKAYLHGRNSQGLRDGTTLFPLSLYPKYFLFPSSYQEPYPLPFPWFIFSFIAIHKSNNQVLAGGISFLFPPLFPLSESSFHSLSAFSASFTTSRSANLVISWNQNGFPNYRLSALGSEIPGDFGVKPKKGMVWGGKQPPQGTVPESLSSRVATFSQWNWSLISGDQL